MLEGVTSRIRHCFGECKKAVALTGDEKGVSCSALIRAPWSLDREGFQGES